MLVVEDGFVGAESLLEQLVEVALLDVRQRALGQREVVVQLANHSAQLLAGHGLGESGNRLDGFDACIFAFQHSFETVAGNAPATQQVANGRRPPPQMRIRVVLVQRLDERVEGVDRGLRNVLGRDGDCILYFVLQRLEQELGVVLLRQMDQLRQRSQRVLLCRSRVRPPSCSVSFIVVVVEQGLVILIRRGCRVEFEALQLGLRLGIVEDFRLEEQAVRGRRLVV